VASDDRTYVASSLHHNLIFNEKLTSESEQTSLSVDRLMKIKGDPLSQFVEPMEWEPHFRNEERESMSAERVGQKKRNHFTHWGHAIVTAHMGTKLPSLGLSR
jgi:hypothetical protein